MAEKSTDRPGLAPEVLALKVNHGVERNHVDDRAAKFRGLRQAPLASLSLSKSETCTYFLVNFTVFITIAPYAAKVLVVGLYDQAEGSIPD